MEIVQALPGLSNLAAAPVAFLNTLIGAADQAIKTYLKRDIELTAYTEFYNGTTQRDVILRQYPVLNAQTTVAAGSNGAVLPQAAINVASTLGFHPGTAGNPGATVPVLSVQVGLTTRTTVSYTGTTATSFTGCAGGTGTLSSATGANNVGTPVVFFDQGGYFGQPQNAFAPGTQMVQGTQFVAVLDDGGRKSNRGLLRRIGGSGQGFVGFYPDIMWSGKLGAYRLPTWPRGDGNIKVQYSAGYEPGKVPFDLQYAAAMLVSYMVRNMPSGAPLQSESLGAYTYQLLQGGQGMLDVPELGSLARTLAPFREVSF